MRKYLNLLINEQGFFKGMASVLDIGATFMPCEYQQGLSAEELDKKALALDWQNVGQDLKDAMNQYE